MRIAYLYSRYPVVSQTFCDSEMLALEALGFELEIVSLNRPPDSFRHERLDRLKAEIHYPPPGAVLDAQANAPEFAEKLGPLITEHDAKYGASLKATTRARNAWHFAPLLKRLGVTHVHVHFANRATHTALFLKKLGFTFSFTAHAQDFMVDLGNDDLLREMVGEAEFVVCVSEFSKSLLANTCPSGANKIVRIYNGIELNDFPTAQAETGGPLRIISIGRLIEFKGFQHLVSAVAELKKRGIAVESRIIGEGPMRGDLEAQIATENLAENVRLLGVRSQEQIKLDLAQAHLFVLPSIVDRKGASDILPTVITEAMACKLPVVSTKLAGIPEMVADGETGLLVEPGDVTALADAIEKMSREPEMRRRLGEAGCKRAEQLFSLHGTAAELAAKFRGVAQGSTAALRTESPVAYVIQSSAGQHTDLECLMDETRLRLIACKTQDDTAADAFSLDRIERLPDEVVLESLWLQRSQWREKVERLRGKIGGAISGEDFYLQARRAIYLADVLPRRGVRHVHAFRSDAVVCVWLVKHLAGLSCSAGIEENPALGRAVLVKLLIDFDLVSNSDEKLASSAGFVARDELLLRSHSTHRILRIGPFRLKRRNRSHPSRNGAELEKAWFEKIIQSIHV